MEIDEVSLKLGEILAKTADNRHDTAQALMRIEGAQREISRKLDSHKKEFTDAIKELRTETEQKLETQRTALEIDATDMKVLKAKGAGVLIGVSALAGFIGAKASVITSLIARLG